MSEELRLSPRAYSNAANMFLVGYVLFQLPGTLLIKRIGPSRQFGGAMILVMPIHLVMKILVHGFC